MADENGKDLVDKGKELASDATDKAQDIASGAVDKAGDAAEAVGDAAGDAVDAVKDLADGAVDKAGDAASAVGGAVSDVAGGAADMAGDAAGAVGDAAGATVDKGKELAGDAASAVGDAAGATVDKGKELAGDAADLVGDAAGAVGDAAGATVDKGKELAGGAVDLAGDAAGAVGDAAGAAAGAVTGAAGAAAGKVGDAFGSVGDSFDGDGDSGSILKWLLPLLLLGLILFLGFMFLSKPGGATTTKEGEATKTGETKATGEAVESSVSIEAKDGKYAISGVVKDQATKDNIKTEAEAVWGAGNVDVEGLKVDANANEFKDGWWDNFKSLLPDLKDWKDGSISWADGAIKTVGEIPGAIADKIKSLFGGWGLPVAIAGAADMAKAANAKAMELLSGADSVEKVVEGLNASIINFATGKSDVPEDAKGILEKAAEVLKKQEAGSTIEVGGHTDNVGDADANLQLSQARADSVRKALIDLGVSESMLTAKGYGQATPKGDNTTEDGRFANRRIEYKVGSGGDEDAAAKE